MRARSTLSAAAALLLAAAPGLAQAPAAPTVPKPPAAQLTKAQIEDVAYEMRVLVSALQSDKVDEPSKEALSQCIYNNAFSKISEAMNKVVADNAGKIDKRNADQMLFVMVRVCGYDPQKAAAAKAAPGAAAPARPATATPAKPVPAKPAAKSGR